MPSRPDPRDRLVVALKPRNAATLAAATKVVAQLAAEVADLDVVDQIAEAVENPVGISSVDAAERAAITYRQLDYWTTHGYVTALPGGTGHGSRRHYAPGEVVKARIMGSLVSLFSMSPGTASLVADQILASGSAEVGGFKVTRKGLAS